MPTQLVGRPKSFTSIHPFLAVVMCVWRVFGRLTRRLCFLRVLLPPPSVSRKPLPYNYVSTYRVTLLADLGFVLLEGATDRPIEGRQVL